MASAYTTNTWEVETRSSGVQGKLLPHKKFEASWATGENIQNKLNNQTKKLKHT